MTDWSTLKKLIWLRIIKGGGSALRTVTGALIHVTNALALPAEALTVNVEPIQAGSGDPSPDNVRHISGRTSATVTRTGKNLLDTSDATHNAYNIGSIPNTLKPNTTYTFSVNGSTTMKFRLYTAKSTAPLSALTPLNIGYISKSDGAQTFTTPSTMDDLLCLAGNNNGAGNESLANILPQVELGSTASAYEPYQGDTYTIALGDTVYGGQLDVTGGKMVVDRAIVDLGTLSWAYSGESSNHRFSAAMPSDYKQPTSAADRADMICSAYASNPNVVSVNNALGVSGYQGTNQVFIRDLAYTDAATFKAAVSGVQLVYELATPIEITLTPTQIEMLLGENNLWADAGDSTLTYYADGNASTSEALGILLGGTYNNPGGADDVSDDEALGILLGGS